MLSQKDRPRILVLCSQGIGDCLMAMPAIDCLRNFYKTMRIDVLVQNDIVSEIINRTKVVDRVYVLRKNPLKNLFILARKVIRQKYDVSITLGNTDQFKGSLFPLICRIKHRIGLTKNRKLHFYHMHVSYNGTSHKIEQNIKIISLLNIYPNSISTPRFIIYPNEQEKIDSFLQSQKTEKSFLVGIVSSSSPSRAGPTRRWETEKFAALGDCLVEEGKIPVFLGDTSDKQTIINNIRSLMKYPNASIDASGIFTLFETGALIRKCKAIIGNDAGLMHIAAALSVPTFTIFGHTNRYGHRPYQKQGYIIYNKKLKCSPCVDINPYGACKEKPCLKGISVQDVLSEFHRIFN